jgi:hypothetical protein
MDVSVNRNQRIICALAIMNWQLIGRECVFVIRGCLLAHVIEFIIMNSARRAR